MQKILLLACIQMWAVGIAYGQDTTLDLSGEWKIKLDPSNSGIEQHWESLSFDDKVKLPGALQNQGYGNSVTATTPWLTNEGTESFWHTDPLYAQFRQPGNVRYPNNLQCDRHYVGAAWYQKQIAIPSHWSGKQIEMLLERCHWLSSVWVDNQPIGSNRSLVAAHRYDLTDHIKPGKSHMITIRVDNSMIVDVGVNSHGYGDQTLTAWNGIIGRMELLAKDDVSVERVEIYPDFDKKQARVVTFLKNCGQNTKTVSLAFNLKSYNTDQQHFVDVNETSFQIAPGTQKVEKTIVLGDKMVGWDEFSPGLYNLNLRIKSDGKTLTHTESFGMRKVEARSRRFYINNRETFMRGNLLCGSFPLTGHYSMNVEDWKHIYMVYKEYGINHVRFHSWTPPQAAFTAADLVGIYIQPELNVWTQIKTDEQRDFFLDEGRLLLECFGNSPSFTTMALGNELSCKKEITTELLNDWKVDNRRLYAGLMNSNGSITDDYQFYVGRQMSGKRTRYQSGWPPNPDNNLLHVYAPQTKIDFADAVAAYDKPMIAHEIGQRCVYPALDVLPQYTGSQRPGYIDIATTQLKERGMFEQWPDFVRATGKFQIEFYKEEFESMFRTPSLAGFHLLQLEDFPGQGGALVGVLDYFYNSKGYVSPEQFRMFNNSIVLLARMEKRVWTSSETFVATAEIANWSAKKLNSSSIKYRIENESGATLSTLMMKSADIPIGQNFALGDLKFALSTVTAPCKLTLKAELQPGNIVNQWDFWVYPDQVEMPKSNNIFVAHQWSDELRTKLEAGANVLLQLQSENIKGSLPPSFLSIYWTQFGKTDGESQSMGMLCDPKHPLFAHFPTESYTTWQWWELLRDASPMIFDQLKSDNCWPKEFRPLVQMVDGWKINRKLGVLAQAQVGKGRLVITTMNLSDNLETRPVARQFRFSLLSYMNSTDFKPETKVNTAQIKELLSANNQTQTIDRPNCTVTATSEDDKNPAKLIMDGNYNTIWHNSYKNESASLPQTITIALDRPRQVGGVRYYPRKDNATGRILAYRAYISNDGKQWGAAVSDSKFEDSAEPQLISFDYFQRTKFIKLEILSTFGAPNASIAELELLLGD